MHNSKTAAVSVNPEYRPVSSATATLGCAIKGATEQNQTNWKSSLVVGDNRESSRPGYERVHNIKARAISVQFEQRAISGTPTQSRRPIKRATLNNDTSTRVSPIAAAYELIQVGKA